MTTPNEETEAWLAIRKEAAKAINPATARVTWEHGQVLDPYGIVPDLNKEKRIGYFARAPISEVWVSFDDLPESVRDELWRRIDQKDPNGPSPFDDDDDLPNVNRLVAEIMARDEGEPGCAAAVAHGIASSQRTRARDNPAEHGQAFGLRADPARSLPDGDGSSPTAAANSESVRSSSPEP